MKYEQYLEEQKLLETPEEVSNLLKTLSGVDIFNKSRKRHIIEHRSLLCYILRNRLNMRWESIKKFMESKGKPYDHATAIHAVKMYPVYKENNKKLSELEALFIVKNKTEYNHISALEVLQKKYNTLEKHYFDSVQKIETQEGKTFLLHLTSNEKQYRELTSEQRDSYNERAALVLKSFKWKARNQQAEVILGSSGVADARGIL